MKGVGRRVGKGVGKQRLRPLEQRSLRGMREVAVVRAVHNLISQNTLRKTLSFPKMGLNRLRIPLRKRVLQMNKQKM